MYLTLKWLHIVFAISWMAGVLYLFRLLVYRAERGQDKAAAALLDEMADRLRRVIVGPAMSVTILCGLGMPLLNPILWRSGWFHAKLTALVLLIGATHFATAKARKVARGTATLPSGRALRWLNEVPTLLMIIIVGMAVFRPF